MEGTFKRRRFPTPYRNVRQRTVLPDATDLGRLDTTDAVAPRLKGTPRAVQTWICLKQLPATTCGRVWRVRAEDLRRFGQPTGTQEWGEMSEFFTEPVVEGLIFFLVSTVPIWTLIWWVNRRDRRRAAESNRRWALQDQLWEMERQIWDEQRSDEERERQRQAQERIKEVKREARRRLGVSEDDV
jgi:hypothetical protein